MAFNKARALLEAESLANQGKIRQAITRYFSIFERDPSELILLNTIGDLYVRDRNVSEGLKQFYRLAEAYVQGGYTLKAIAIYKKIVKLEPDPVGPLLKLVELYQAQRLAREARELYYQVAECYKKKKQNDKALETLRKAVQLDVENRTARAHLAAFCEEIGRKDEAAQVYMENAQLALRRGDTGAAQIALKKAQELAPDDPQIPLLMAREALVRKHPEDVEAILSGTSGLTKDPAGRSLLIDSYLAMRQPEKAETLVLDVFRAAPADFSPLASFVSVCVQLGRFDTASKALSAVADELIAQGNTSSLMESLRLIRSRSPQHLPTLELIFQICESGGEGGAPQDILEALGQAYLQGGQFKKAVQSFQRLVDREPLNEHYNDLLGQALQKQAEELGIAQVADLPRSAAAFIREKAAATTGLRLESVRPQAVRPEPLALRPAQPSGIPAGEIDLASRPSLTPVQEGQEISSNLALPPAPQALPPARSESPLDLATLAPSAIPTGPYSEIQEIDLSEDWEVFLAQRTKSSQGLQAPQQALSFNYDDSRIEISFYLEHGFLEEANGAVGELERMLPGDPRIAELRGLVEAHTGAVAIEGLEKEPAKAVEGTPEELVAPPGGETVEGQALSSNNAMPEPEAKPAAGLPFPPREERPPTDATPGWVVATSADLLSDFAEGFESALEKLNGPAPALAEEIPTEAAPGVSVEASAKLLGDFSEAFESATGSSEGVSSPPVPSSGPTAPFIPSPPSREGDETVQEPSPEDDPEVHYNLGVAFWEMNLPDEAIRELQQVVKGAGIGPQPPNYLEACALLATCFMDKGMASEAVKWYSRALEAPHLDEEAWLALHYDLGVAYELTGDLPRAREEFSEVYSRNIAFRDVAEKVRSFQQKGSSG